MAGYVWGQGSESIGAGDKVRGQGAGAEPSRHYWKAGNLYSRQEPQLCGTGHRWADQIHCPLSGKSYRSIWRRGYDVLSIQFNWLVLSFPSVNQETACAKCFEEVTDNLCIVFDLAEFSTSCMDHQLVKNIIWLLSKHYPERLGVCLILNSPTIFSTIWPVIRGWLDENTSKKVVFVNSEMDLCNYLIPDILPTDM